MRQHRRALVTLGVAACLDIAAGLLFAAVQHTTPGIGLYWALSTATTVGYGDITPHGTLAHLIASAAMLTVVPLFAATFSLLTSGLTAEHVRSEGHEMRRRLDHIIRLHEDR